jgi:hypothetical protein
MLKRINLLIALFSLLALPAISQLQYPVTWAAVRNVDIDGNAITKTTGSKGIGLATSDQILFARGEGNVYSGYFSYSPGGPAGDPWNGEIKNIGYAPINDPDIGDNVIVYGFSFGKNNKLKMFSPEGQVTQTFNSMSAVTLERDNKVMRYLVDGVEVYSVIVSVTESLEIRAKMKSNGSSFSGITTNYQTTPFCISPLVDNTKKTIELTVTGAYPPYKLAWANGDLNSTTSKGRVETRYVEGQNLVTIYDAIGNKIQRVYSLGTLVDWTSLYQANSDQVVVSNEPEHTVLSNPNTNNKWGTAIHSSGFADNSKTWVEYTNEEETGGAKAFGFVDQSITVRKIQHLKAGFLISKDNLQVIEAGAVVLTTNYTCKDVLRISYQDGKVIWYQNGDRVYDATYVKNGAITIAGLVKKAGTLKDVNYSSNQPSIVNTTWDDLAETGTINIDLGSIVGVTGPFHYMISEEPIPHLDDVYGIIKDSILIDVDSVSFYTGTESLTTHSFDNLKSGTYHVTAFNSDGKRLFAEEVHMQGDFVFETQSNLVASGATISAPVQAGYGELEMFTHEELNSELKVSVRRNGTSFIGYAEAGTNVTQYQDLVYGFYLDKKRLFTVENGVLSTTFTVVRRNEAFYFKTLDGVLSLSTAQEELKSIALPAEYTYKVALGMAKSQGFILYPIQFQKKKFKVYTKIQQYLGCDGNNGIFSISMNSFGSWNGMGGTFTITHQESGDVIVPFGIINDQPSPVIPVTTNGLGGPLEAGIYEIVVTVNGISITKYVCLGYEAKWDPLDFVDFDLTPNTYSLLRTLPNGTSTSYARAENVLPISQTGWMEFTPVTDQSSAYSYMRLSTQNITSTALSPTEDVLAFGRFWSGVIFVRRINSVVSFSFIPLNSVIKTKYQSGQIEIWVNGALQSIETATNQTRLVRGQTPFQVYGFRNVITSFSCTPKQPLSTIGYTELKKELDGGFAHAVEGKVKFTFDEEYDIQAGDVVSLNIYGNDYSLLEQINSDGTSLNGTVGVPYVFDDNKRILDISGVPGLVTDEHYILEVVTSTEEKLYMRFIYKY